MFKHLLLGNILWRQVLERDPHDSIVLLSPSSSNEAIIVSKGPRNLVRAFDYVSGALVWEWSLPTTLPLDK